MGTDRAVYPARAFAFSLCNRLGDKAFIRWPVDPTTREVIKDERTFDLLQELLGNAALTAVFFNCPFDYRKLRMAGFDIKCKLEDTLINQSVINPDEFDNRLKPLCKKYLGISDEDEKSLILSIHKTRRKVQAARRAKDKDPLLSQYALSDDVAGDMFLGDQMALRTYAKLDAFRTASLRMAQHEHFNTDLVEEKGRLWEVQKREHRVMESVRRMEDRGTCIDMAATKDIISFYEQWTGIAQFGINANGGRGLNPRSPKQMTKHFFGTLGHHPLKYSVKKTREGKIPVKCMHCKGKGCDVCQDTGHNPKCDGDFLQAIGVRHEEDDQGNDQVLPADKLAYWMLYYKASGTMLGYTRQYRDLSVKEGDDWILHPNFKQVEAVTGRFSCERPNLQNVASDDSGKKRIPLAYRSRECFVPRPGCLFYIPDYSQIEVWIFALVSNDKTMLDILYAGGDFHAHIAKMVWGHLWNDAIATRAAKKRPQDLTIEEKRHLGTKKRWRKRAKNVMFTKLYGGGIDKVAETIGCSYEDARQFVADYDARLPGVDIYMRRTIALAREQGFVINPYGRRYQISRDMAYKATNYMVQGTAADVMKNALNRVDDLCQTKYRDQMNLLLQIHDELIIEVAEEAHNEQVMRDVVTAMAADYKYLGCKIPFPIGMKIARERWSETQDIELAAA